MITSSIVGLLRTYGPSASSEALYDEHVLKSVETNSATPIEIGSSLVDDLISNFRSCAPSNVILTGTAGDGKTWHARKIFTGLGGSIEAWTAGEGIVEYTLPSKQTLVVVKDLSQFHEDIRQEELMRGLVASLLRRDDKKVYLVAANDGQLLRFWRTYFNVNTDTISLDEKFRAMLKDNLVEIPTLNVLMHNLSQRNHKLLFESAISAIEQHDGWKECEDCSIKITECPIRRNLKTLTSTEMRQRLREIISLSAANDTHLPTRHVFLLIANILLGVSGKKSVLLDCETARALVANGEENLSNPFDNALGLNLRPSENKGYLAFMVFEKAGIGLETTSFFDRLLIEKRPENLHTAYVANDVSHGEHKFDKVLRLYHRGSIEDFSVFRAAIEAQRRRLFFVLPSNEQSGNVDPWRLSVFVHGGAYLRFSADLAAGRSVERVKRQLVMGINRSLSGLMCDDDTVIWFTSPAANAQSRIGRVLDIEVPLGGNKRANIAFEFEYAESHSRPQMVVKIRPDAGGGLDLIERHPLQPILFEYLMRVAHGSLPGSFSRQCFEELRQFRLRVVAQLTNEEYISAEDVRAIDLIRLDKSGRLLKESIGVA